MGLVAFFITVFASVKGSKSMKMVPFIIGILGAYVIALVMTLIGNATGCEALQLVHLSAFDNMQLFKLPPVHLPGYVRRVQGRSQHHHQLG